MMLTSIIYVSFLFVYSVVAETEIDCTYRQSDGVKLPGTCIKPGKCAKIYPELDVLFPCNDNKSQQQGLFCCPKSMEEVTEINCRYSRKGKTIPGICVQSNLCNIPSLNNLVLHECHENESERQGLICCPKDS
ncbi:uncharacterized protein LOC127287696 isoform X2 [Leptopilina boulardi]|uniref:uncharacterized protein LOC127287696 isoform X2 n=1 Tax=Leptopilina boulardi TaxID=63433 RepID=UPI0021F5A79F|nr:uncharacterized protein LOC127287696 isoform X2 [Leptopilina boulardi]